VGRSAGGRSTLREINREACHFPGLPVLQTLLPKHTNVPELYFLLMALFLQQPVTELPDSLQVHVSTATLSFFFYGLFAVVLRKLREAGEEKNLIFWSFVKLVGKKC